MASDRTRQKSAATQVAGCSMLPIVEAKRATAILGEPSRLFDERESAGGRTVMWKTDQSVTRSRAPNADGTFVETVMDIGKSVVIKGELSASEDLTLSGQMEGSIKLPAHTLTVGSGADIKAEISAKIVVIMGAVTGNVTAGDKLEIQTTGSVTGDIVSPRLVIADGGRLHGIVQMPRSEPSRVPKS